MILGVHPWWNPWIETETLGWTPWLFMGKKTPWLSMAIPPPWIEHLEFSVRQSLSSPGQDALTTEVKLRNEEAHLGVFSVEKPLKSWGVHSRHPSCFKTKMIIHDDYDWMIWGACTESGREKILKCFGKMSQVSPRICAFFPGGEEKKQLPGAARFIISS